MLWGFLPSLPRQISNLGNGILARQSSDGEKCQNERLLKRRFKLDFAETKNMRNQPVNVSDLSIRP